MIIIELNFVLKVLLEGCVAQGYREDEFKISHPTEDSFSLELFSKTFLFCKVQRSVVSEVPAQVWLTKMSVCSVHFLKIAEYLQQTLGDRVKIYLS